MAADGTRIMVELDAQMVARARGELGLDSGSDTDVVERALNAYLLGRLLDATQHRSGLSEADATRLAYEEIRAARGDHDAA